MIPIVRPTARVEIETHVFPDASCLLFDPLTQDGHVLDSFGALVWDYCDGQLTIEEIATEVGALVPQYTDAKEQVRAIIEEYSQRGLLILAGTSPQASETASDKDGFGDR